jgi:NADH:ubiquinone oxidoreductase subunit K
MAGAGTRAVTVGLVTTFFVAAGLIATGAFAAVWRRDLTAALAAIPLMFAGVGVAFVGVARFGAVGGPQLFGQEFAVVLAVAATALVVLGLGIAGREAPR